MSHSSTRPPITSHVLDTGRGRPAVNVPVLLEYAPGAVTSHQQEGVEALTCYGILTRSTNDDGRCPGLSTSTKALQPGCYRVTFDTKAYYAQFNERCFYPFVQIVFELTAPEDHYHIPLLLSPYSYSTYRGS
ncbi:transthyretin [Syncephalis pseudoplumigaleata]|uniref:5-hydroxyisourate hydrolase n=1 Tax=Syncephalis pseudoplumigaleata TaxID=1712513 RepID=A0A4P9Z1D3_9FUNG|nr:transthyretin [Syncephalis pseudoplumigaleata]|eukprot:RKP26115.1 transthyretin [Syncephalis pseudoplumigaleata]